MLVSTMLTCNLSNLSGKEYSNCKCAKKIGDFIKEAAYFLLFSNCILAVNRCHVSDQVKNLVRITDFVVIPRNNLYECIC